MSAGNFGDGKERKKKEERGKGRKEGKRKETEKGRRGKVLKNMGKRGMRKKVNGENFWLCSPWQS